MREGRRWRRRSADGAFVAVLLTLSACGPQPSAASPDGAVSMQGSPTAAPGTPASAAASASVSADVACDPALAYVLSVEAGTGMPGTPVRVRIEGFPPNAAVTLRFGSMYAGTVGPPIGAATIDEVGNGVVHGLLPADAPYGDAALSVMVNAECGAETYLAVVGSSEGIGIDDDTVVAGQQVTITASGFAPEDEVVLFLDGDGRDAGCICRDLALAQTNELGAVRIVVRIPRDLPPGAHFLTLNGDSFNHEHDLGLIVQITVER